MKRSLLVMLGLVISLTAVGCGSDSGLNSGPHAVAGALYVDPSLWRSWSVSYQAECEDVPADKCFGNHGFSVTNTGIFEVGPGPDGELMKGSISEDELKLVSQTFSKILSTTPARLAHRQLSCAAKNASGTVELLRWRPLSEQNAVAHIAETGYCGRSPDVPDETVLTLGKQLRALAKKYQPDHFPSRCVTAAHDFHLEQEKTQVCEKDSDCSYVDSLFNPIPTGSTSHSGDIVSDDCTYIQPLVVANAFRIVTNQRGLTMRRELTRRVCGQELGKANCEVGRHRVSISAPPECRFGRCRVGN